MNAKKLSAWCAVLGVVVLLTGGAPPTRGAKDASAWFEQAENLYFDAKPKEAVAAFNKVIELKPDAAPQLWQRGLALYYAGDYAEGRKQFELHRTVNPDDVENAAWHFLCVAKGEGLEAARQALLPIHGDTRVPMREIYELFAGRGSEDAVLKAAETGDKDSLEHRNQLCYAHLYLGLYHEALGHTDLAKEHLLKAAKEDEMDHYMGRTAQVHVMLRGWDQAK